jgi:hypothetical protein
MYDVKGDIVKALAATPKVLAVLLPAALKAESRGTTARPGWSAVQIICHLRDAEERALERMQKMRDEENPVIESYDQEAWARDRRYESQDPLAALDRFVMYRQAHREALEGLALPHWERTGQHQEMGRITILGHTLHMLSHDLGHLAQLSALR